MQPLFYAALAFALGIGASRFPGIPLLSSFATLGALAAVTIAVVRSPRSMGRSALLFCSGLLFFFVAGYLRGLPARRRELQPIPLQQRAARLESRSPEGIWISGYLRDAPVLQPGYLRLDLEATALEGAGEIWQVDGGVRLYSYPPWRNGNRAGRGSAPPWPGRLATLAAGEGVRLLAHVHPPRAFHDPGVTDATLADRRNGLALTGTITPGQWQPAPDLRAPAGLRHRSAAWRWISRGLDQLVPAARSPRLNAVLHGMLLGDLDRLDEGTRKEFQIDGIYHLLVVAGLHVGVLAGVLMLLFTRLGWRRLPAGALTLLVLLAYAWVIAARTPTLRATLMIGIYFIARAWYRERQPLNAVGAAALVLLALHPLDLFTAGFQMSFGAATLLAGIVVPLLARTSHPLVGATRRLADTGFDEAFEPRVAQFRLDLRMLATRLGWLWHPLGWRIFPLLVRIFLEVYEVMVVSLVLQIGFSGFMAVYFHRANPWTPLVNAVAVPLASLMLPLAWCGLLLQALWPALAAPLGWLLRGLGSLLLATAAHGSRWPAAGMRVPTPPVWALLGFAAVMAAWLVLTRHSRRMKQAGFAAALAAAALLNWFPFAPRLPRGKLCVTALDVGQGDAIFVVFPDQRTLLVDGGPVFGGDRNAGTDVVCPYLWSLGLRHIDAVLLTHAHEDHIGGLPPVLENFHPEAVWVSRTLPQDPRTRAFLKLAAQEAAHLRRVAAGERYRVGSTYLDVLLPPPDYVNGELPSNNDSVVVRLAYGRASVLLEGDAEAAGEEWMLDHHEEVRSTLLKVAHHGSSSSSISPLLQAVDPAVAFISVGVGNRYGLPSRSTIAALRREGAHVYRTDRNGAEECELDGKSLTVLLDVPPQRIP